MLIPIHAEITQIALGGIFTPKILEQVIKANQKQDGFRGQIGHPEFHFDDNKIYESQRFIEDQRILVFKSLNVLKLDRAWQAFGRLLHTTQDFYAHSNYVLLWMAQLDKIALPSAEEIEPLQQNLLISPQLTSGELYYPLEILSFMPLLKKYVLPRLPRNSHAWMNLDSPAAGVKFEYAFSAAVKRTVIEFENISLNISNEMLGQFIGG